MGRRSGISVKYFIEDLGHKKFVIPLTHRIIEHLHNSPLDIEDDYVSANIIKDDEKHLKRSYKRFISELEKSEPLYDMVIIVVDGNCKGFRGRKAEFRRKIKSEFWFSDRMVFAVPDPHIERWYLMDQKAFKEGTGAKRAPDLPKYKCERGYYKKILSTSISDCFGEDSLSGGVEYGEEIVNCISDLSEFCNLDDGCKAFYSEIRSVLNRVK